MKTRLWRQAVTRHLIPSLPGTWNIAGKQVLFREPVEWILPAIAFGTLRHSSTFVVTAVVQLLARPTEHLTGPHLRQLGRGSRRGHWESPTTLVDAEPVMRQVLDLIQAEALPYLDRLSNLEALTAEHERLAQEVPEDVHYQESLFICRLLQNDLAGALQAAEQAAGAGRADGRDWALKVAERVTETASVAARDRTEAVEILRGRAQESRRWLKVPNTVC